MHAFVESLYDVYVYGILHEGVYMCWWLLYEWLGDELLHECICCTL